MKWTEIRLSLEKTDIPGTPGNLPIQALVSIVEDKLHIRAERTGTIGADVVFEFDISKQGIMSFKVKLVADVPDDFEYSPWRQPELSSLTLVHKDPYNVDPHFTTVFASDKGYWIKAFREMLIDKFDIARSEG